MDNKAEIARSHLKSLGMTVHNEWLTGCVEFFNESHTRAFNRKEFCDFVQNQWILGDLRVISPGCLPPNLAQHLKTDLNGIYTMQMNEIIDVGLPAYQQLQKLEKIDVTNIEATENTNYTEISNQRMLKLTLTDGSQVISAIEYRPMRNININLTPGVKIQIKGPIVCRRGVLMLEEKHVSVLGGEVEDLLDVNNYKNVLARKIGGRTDSAPTFNREPVVNPPIVPIEDELDSGMFNDDNFDIAELDFIESQLNDANNSFNEPPTNRPIKVSKMPYVYLKQLHKLSEQLKSNKTYIVKGQITRIVKKLALQKNNWVLTCKLWDGSDELDVEFSTELLSSIIGYSPEDMMRIKREMSGKPELKQQLLEALEKAKIRIQNMNCLFHVRFTETGPYVDKTEPITFRHISQLQDRISAAN